MNEAVLRAFEQEMGVEVIRPDIAGLMELMGLLCMENPILLPEAAVR